MADKFTTVRLSISGEHFEILVYPEAALNYKLGRAIEPSEVLAFDQVYSDSTKGLRVSDEKLQKHFNTKDVRKVVESILKRGELQLTTEQRRKMVDDKRRQIVQTISKNYVDPKTRIPHPVTRIEQAIEEAGVQIDPFKVAEEQSAKVVESLRTILPLTSERSRFRITVPAQFAPQSIGLLKSFGSLQEESWGADGSFTSVIEVPAGSKANLLERLGSLTKGSAQAVEAK